MPGFKPRPNHLKALAGVAECRINRDEPLPAEGAIVPPVELSDDARAIWDRLAPDLIAQKVLTAWDVDGFAAFCRWMALSHDAARLADLDGRTSKGSQGQKVVSPHVRMMELADKMARSRGGDFGLTPGDRAGLKVDHGSGRGSGVESYLG